MIGDLLVVRLIPGKNGLREGIVGPRERTVLVFVVGAGVVVVVLDVVLVVVVDVVVVVEEEEEEEVEDRLTLEGMNLSIC